MLALLMAAFDHSSLIADIHLPPPDPPVCSVMQEQTGRSRLHLGHSGGCDSFSQADIRYVFMAGRARSTLFPGCLLGIMERKYPRFERLTLPASLLQSSCIIF